MLVIDKESEIHELNVQALSNQTEQNELSVIVQNDTHLNTPSKSPTNNEKVRKIRKQKPKQPGIFPCDICNKTFKWESSLRYHKQTHNFIEMHCLVCSIVFINKLELRLHMLVVHKIPENRPYHCDICGRSFITKGVLRSHMHLHGTRFQCSKCGLRCQCSTQLKMHKLKHSKKYDLKCSKCFERFKHPKSLKQHSKAVHVGYGDPKAGGKSREFFYCTEEGCSRFYVTKTNLQNHSYRLHSDIIRFPCKVDGCTKAFKVQPRLTAHYNSAHSLK